jgi:hypothetical protein
VSTVVKSRKAKLAAGLTAGAMMLSISAPAMAQTQGTEADFGASASKSASVQTTQGTQVAQINTGNLISALNNINAEINNIEALNDLTVSDVRVVDVDNVLNNNDVRAFNNALNRNSVDIDALQDFLNDNEVVVDALNNNDVDVSDVVAVDVLSDGTVVIFVD